MVFVRKRRKRRKIFQSEYGGEVTVVNMNGTSLHLRNDGGTKHHALTGLKLERAVHVCDARSSCLSA